MIVRLTLIGKPVSHKNGYRIVTIGGRPAIVKSKEAIDFERFALQQIPPRCRLRLEGPVRVTLRLFYENERPDLDESIVLDVLQDRFGKRLAEGQARPLVQAGVYRNDRQVREKHVFHAIDRKNPRTEIEVEALQAQQPSVIAADLFAECEPLPF